jgi:hypothetical protein
MNRVVEVVSRGSATYMWPNGWNPLNDESVKVVSRGSETYMWPNGWNPIPT